jgi:peroxiredoxin
LRSLEHTLPAFGARDLRVAAVSVDPADATRRLAEKQGYTFTLLSDPEARVIRRYDLLDAHSGLHGADIARPAEFLIDPSGTIRWRNLTEDYRVRIRGDQVLRVLDGLGGRS